MAKKQNIEKAQREMTKRQKSRHEKQQRRQRIIFFGGIGVIVAVVLIILGGWFSGEYIPLHKVILQVYDTSFDNSFFIDALVLYGSSQGSLDLSTIASNLLDQIKQNEIIKQAAEKLGITVSDADADQYIASTGLAINAAVRELARGALLVDKVRTAYFGPQVPDKDTQLLVRAMLVESDTIAQLVRDQIISGANFTELVKKYAVDSASQSDFGDYGWHPLSLFKDKFFSTIPLDYISRADVKAGDLSGSLADNTSSKTLGYWLIKVNNRPDNNSANVSALLLDSEEQALAVRARLQAGEALGPIADNLSQYNASQTQHGEMGLIFASDNVSDVFNGYAFNLETELGQWSQPLRDSNMYTRDGVWVVWVVDKQENRDLSADDRDQLTSNLYNNWVTEINNAAVPYVVNNMTQDLLQFAIQRATKILSSG